MNVLFKNKDTYRKSLLSYLIYNHKKTKFIALKNHLISILKILQSKTFTTIQYIPIHQIQLLSLCQGTNKRMLKQFLVISGIASLPLMNEYTKTFITKTNTFKKTIFQINSQLTQININLNEVSNSHNQTHSNQSLKELKQPQSQPQSQSQQQQFFDIILTPQIQKMLSKKSKHKIQFIQKLKNQQHNIIETNAYILGIHVLGSLVSPFFYYSACAYAFYSQLTLINDLVTLKTGNKFINLHSKTIYQLYLKLSVTTFVLCGLRIGINKLSNFTQTKQIIRKDS